MRPVRTVAAFVFATAILVTGCTTHSNAVHPSATPNTVAPAPAPTPPPQIPSRPAASPQVAIDRVPAPRPVLADGSYDAYIRTVDLGRNRIVVDLVQVFLDDAATRAAIADGKPRHAAQGLNTYIRNQNPRLRTLPLARDLQVDVLRGNETAEGCGGPSLIHKLNLLISDVSYHSPNLYFTLTVGGGAVHHIKEVATQPAC